MKRTVQTAYVVKYDEYEGQKQFCIGIKCQGDSQHLVSIEVHKSINDVYSSMKEVEKIGYVNDIDYLVA